MIRTVSFDFWDTLAADDSDEEKRLAQGLFSKPQARLALWIKEIQKTHPEISRAQIEAAFHQANERFQIIWKKEARTLPVDERYAWMFSHLGIPRSPHYAEIVREIEEMETTIRPDPVPRLKETLQELSKRVKLAIISDTIHTPGRGLRKILSEWEVSSFFSVMIFSDEVGVSKPHPKVFEMAATGTGCFTWEMIHVGDREDKDIEGAKKVGARAALITQLKDRRSPAEATRADWVCEKFERILEIVSES